MTAEKESKNLIITGVGGQGNVLSSQILGQALVGKGYFVTIGETYGASQRGGSVMSHIRLSSLKQLSPLIPQGKADVVLGLEPVEALRVLTGYGYRDTVVITNTRPIYPVDVTSGDERYPEMEELETALRNLSRKLHLIPATERALEMGSPILGNMIMIGALLELNLLPLTAAEFSQTLKQNFQGKRLESNLQALETGAILMGK
ncbi:MAG: indolepyruvate oxidoreductase subunit beta [Deltaproteobacteria bacterium]|nr:indolepyruvate oxidoreductase subunit beta [Deltaproteobacteria bacterium]